MYGIWLLINYKFNLGSCLLLTLYQEQASKPLRIILTCLENQLLLLSINFTPKTSNPVA